MTSPIAQHITTLSSRTSPGGRLMYPGFWVMTYARLSGTGVWFLISMVPAQPVPVDREGASA